MSRLRFTILAVVYGVYVLIAAFYPFRFSGDLELIRQGLAAFFGRPGGRDFIENILLFIPFGVLFYGWPAADRGKGSAIVYATFFGAVISLFIELTQLFFFRHCSVFDVLANTLGTSAGAILAALMPRKIADRASRLWTSPRASPIAALCAFVFALLPLGLSALQFFAPFYIWDSRFSFQLANEATLDRPWLGKIHFVALYSRALSADDVRKHFYEGFASAAQNNPGTKGLIALYSFSEGRGDTVHDVSGYKPPVDLVISPEAHVRWINSPNGIEILHPAIIRNQTAGMKLVDAFRATNELSIEVWMAPRDTTQDGPARIVSFSRDGSTRNFTLGQGGSHVQFRLRTPISGKNGTPLALKTSPEFSIAETSHVVATYKNGVERFYVNGKEQAEVLNLTSEGIVGFGTSKTPPALTAYSFFYFFPVTFFWGIFSTRSSRSARTLLLPAAIGIGLMGLTDIFQAFAFHRAIDIRLMGYGLIIAVLGALSGRAFCEKSSYSEFPVKKYSPQRRRVCRVRSFF